MRNLWFVECQFKSIFFASVEIFFQLSRMIYEKALKNLSFKPFLFAFGELFSCYVAGIAEYEIFCAF